MRGREAEEQVSLDVFNAVRPDEALTMDEMRSFKSSARDHVDFLARLDGTAVGSAIGVILPQRAGRVFAMVRVLPERRRRGAGAALYGAISAWTAERGLKEIEVPVLDNDPESLAFAQQRGFVEERRELGLVLHLAERSRHRPSSRPTASRSSPGRSGQSSHATSTRSCSRRNRTSRVSKTTMSSPSRTGSSTTCKAPATARRRPSSR